MKTNIKIFGVLNLFLIGIAIFFMTAIGVSIYCFVTLKDSLVILNSFVYLIGVAIVVFVSIKISKFVKEDGFEESERLETIKISEDDFGELFEEGKNKAEEKFGRKAKRYIPKNNGNITVVYNRQREEIKEIVGIVDISRTGVMITSNKKLSNSLKLELKLKEKIEGYIVRNGINESKNLYFYGIKFQNAINNSEFKQILQKI